MWRACLTRLTVCHRGFDMSKEAVNHPSHYKTDGARYEAIDVIEDWNLGFSDGNAVKYICRHRFKKNPIQDIKKAIWYLKRHLENLEAEYSKQEQKEES